MTTAKSQKQETSATAPDTARKPAKRGPRRSRRLAKTASSDEAVENKDSVSLTDQSAVEMPREADDSNLMDATEAEAADAASGGVSSTSTRAEGEESPSETPSKKSRSKDDEMQSFLAMYFRDMAELNVLKPQEEFETAKNIEQLEIELWVDVLSHRAVSAWICDAVAAAMDKPAEGLAKLTVLAAPGQKLQKQKEKEFSEAVERLAAELRESDIDRLFIEAAVNAIRKALAEVSASRDSAFGAFAQRVLSKQAGIKRAKNAFVKANLRLVVSIARRFNHGRLPLPDLIQEGNIGLMKAVERYDYRRGFRFSTYASWWIRHAISRALADKGRAVRLPVHMIDAYHRIAKSERELQSKLERPATTEEVAEAAGIDTEKLEKMRTFLSETPVSLDRPVSDDDGRRLIDILEDPQDTLSTPDAMVISETHQEMLKLLTVLKPIEADILRKRFGLSNDRERTLKEIGDEYRLSRERVRQLQEQALGKMRKAMAKMDAGY